MFQRDTDPPPPPLPELEYSPGPVDMATPHWDDLSENHDPDRLVSNQCGRYNHPLIFFAQLGHHMTTFFILLCPPISTLLFVYLLLDSAVVIYSHLALDVVTGILFCPYDTCFFQHSLSITCFIYTVHILSNVQVLDMFLFIS